MHKVSPFEMSYEGSAGMLRLDCLDVVVRESDIMSYRWNADTVALLNGRGGVLSRFYTEPGEYSLELEVWAGEEDEFRGKFDELVRLCEADVLARTEGRLRVNREYLRCFVTGLQTEELTRNYCHVTLTVFAPVPFWVEESTSSFFLESGESITNGRKYARKYLDRYVQDGKGNLLVNDHYGAAAMKLIIFGPADRPLITIAGHPYQYEGKLENGERVEIDQNTMTVTKIYANGTRENAFALRGKKESVFKRIPPGNNLIVSSGAYGFDIVLYRERSIPKWRAKNE